METNPLTTVVAAVAAAVLSAGAYSAHADNSGDVRDQDVQRKPAEPTYTLPYEPPNPMPASQERDGIEPMDMCGHCVRPESGSGTDPLIEAANSAS